MYTYIYIYTYVCIHIYTYTYTYMYIWTKRERVRERERERERERCSSRGATGEPSFFTIATRQSETSGPTSEASYQKGYVRNPLLGTLYAYVISVRYHCCTCAIMVS